MGRAPCCSKVGLHRGPWTPREDTLLTKYIQAHGEGHWRSLPKKAGLLRCGKSCRLRWMNYLRPDIKRGNITSDEDDLIIRMHALLGNRWSLIAGRLPGRTDNEIKNYWNTHLSKKLRSQGTDPTTHKKLPNDPLQEANNKKKRKNKLESGASNKKNNKSSRLADEPQKPKVHLPKPVRLTSLVVSLPRNDSFDCNTNSTLSCSQEGEEADHQGITDEQVLLEVDSNNWWDRTNVNNGKDSDDVHNIGVSFFVGDDQEMVNGSDPESNYVSSAIMTTTNVSNNNNNHFEKLYDEYYQLLKSTDDQDQYLELDSFAESLLL